MPGREIVVDADGHVCEPPDLWTTRLPARLYWDDQWVTTLNRPHAIAGIEPYASRLKAKPDELISIFTPESINIAVLGGETQGAFKMIGGRFTGSSPGADKKGNPVGLIDIWR